MANSFRAEIAGLRAVAVISVLLFHLKVDGFQGGFVGVDIFFVISGYLITRNILADLQAGSVFIWSVLCAPDAPNLSCPDLHGRGHLSRGSTVVLADHVSRRGKGRHARTSVDFEYSILAGIPSIFCSEFGRTGAVALLVAVARGTILSALAGLDCPGLEAGPNV